MYGVGTCGSVYISRSIGSRRGRSERGVRVCQLVAHVWISMRCSMAQDRAADGCAGVDPVMEQTSKVVAPLIEVFGVGKGLRFREGDHGVRP